MSKLENRAPLPATAAELAAWFARPGAAERLAPPFARRGYAVGPIELPFRRLVLTPKFADGALIDEVEFEAPAAQDAAEREVRRVLAYRAAVLKADLERHARFASAPRATVAITGANGLIGRALSSYLTTGGHTVRAVKRGDFSVLSGCDAVVHLAGAPIGQRWSASLRVEIVESRIGYTRKLVDAMRALPKPPAVLLSGSAIGVYGERKDEQLDESSTLGGRAERGAGFIAALCADWEAEAMKAGDFARVVTLRTGVVLSSASGALHQMLPAFELYAGGPIGSGRQYTSWISLEDELGAIEHALFDASVSGPLNLTAPEPVRYEDISKALGRVLHKPSVMRVPAFVLRAMFGESAEAALLASQRVVPKRLLAAGFAFWQADLEQCLRFTLGR